MKVTMKTNCLGDRSTVVSLQASPGGSSPPCGAPLGCWGLGGVAVLGGPEAGTTEEARRQSLGVGQASHPNWKTSSSRMQAKPFL